MQLGRTEAPLWQGHQPACIPITHPPAVPAPWVPLGLSTVKAVQRTVSGSRRSWWGREWALLHRGRTCRPPSACGRWDEPLRLPTFGTGFEAVQTS